MAAAACLPAVALAPVIRPSAATTRACPHTTKSMAGVTVRLPTLSLPLRRSAVGRPRPTIACRAQANSASNSNGHNNISLAHLASAQVADRPTTTGNEHGGSNVTSWLPSLDEMKNIVRAFLTALLKPALIGLVLAAMLTSFPHSASAAKGGGRMGGSSFSSSRGRSSSSASYSYSAPQRASPPLSYSAPFAAPVPFFAPTPFFFGPTIFVGGGGSGLFKLMLLGMVMYTVVTAVRGFLAQREEEEMWAETQRSSVVKLQVGLLGNARQLQKDLERLAMRADTESQEGLHYVLQETVLSLLRHPDYCVYGMSTSEVAKDSYEGEQAFNKQSLQERSKFQEETLVNVGAIQRKVERKPSAIRSTSEYIVVTILAAAEGSFELPEVKSSEDLRAALTKLGSIAADELQAVEILWTPENDEDTLSTTDMLADYPLLRPL